MKTSGNSHRPIAPTATIAGAVYLLYQTKISRPALDLFWQVLYLADRDEVFRLLTAGKADISQHYIPEPALLLDRVFTSDQLVQHRVSILCDL